MRKYESLQHFLHGARASRIALGFSEIERILGAQLPASARAYHPLWANEEEGSHVQTPAWLDAGWRVAGVDLEGERVQFQRA